MGEIPQELLCTRPGLSETCWLESGLVGWTVSLVVVGFVFDGWDVCDRSKEIARRGAIQ